MNLGLSVLSPPRCGMRGTQQVVACTPGFIPATGLGREAGPVAAFLLRWVLDGVLKWIGLVSWARPKA